MVPPGWLAFLLPLLMASFTPAAGQHGVTQGFRVSGTNHSYASVFPHHAMIVGIREPWEPKVCGGSLVAPQWVLTSAYCLRSCHVNVTYAGPGACYINYRVILGANNLFDRMQKRFLAQAVEVDPAHSTGSMFELALLKLDKPAEITDKIRPVSLPWNPTKSDKLLKNKIFFTGWGMNKDGAARTGFDGENDVFGDDNLGVGTMTAWNHPSCFAFTFIPANHEKSFLCTSGDRPCPGDIGGALVVQASSNSTKWVQLAVSTGPAYHSCARSAVPILSTRLDPYLPWIKNVTRLEPERGDP